MTTTSPLEALHEEDRPVLLAALKALAADDQPALIPLPEDLDGDGICDAWGLSEDGTEIVFVSGVTLAETAYVSDGNDITAPEA